MCRFTEARTHIDNLLVVLDSSLEQTANDFADELRIARRLLDEGLASISPPPPTLARKRVKPTSDELWDQLRYNADQGGLIYRSSGKKVTSTIKAGYRSVKVRGGYGWDKGWHTALVSRTLYCMLTGEWPEGLDVAHENDMSLDDRLHNIVAVPRWVNLMMGGVARGESPARGVGFDGSSYRVMGPSVGGAHPFYASFDTLEEAVEYRFSLYYQELNRRKAARDALIPAFMKRNG